MLAGTTGLTNALRFRGSWSYTHAALSQDSPGLLEVGADAFKDDRLSGAPKKLVADAEHVFGAGAVEAEHSDQETAPRQDWSADDGEGFLSKALGRDR